MANFLKLGTQFFAEGDFAESDTLGNDIDFNFEDAETETSEQVNTPAGQETEENPNTQTKELQSNAQIFEVKYNGEVVKLTLEELTTNAQKGMNYDKVFAEREELKSAKEFELLDKLAQDNGMTRAQYIDAIEKQHQQDEINRLSQSGIPPEVAERIYTLEKAEKDRMEKDLAMQEQNAKQKQFNDFAENYPDVKEFPPEVIAKLTEGESPLNAYMAYENKQLKQEIQTLKQNKTNATTATGSLVGSQPSAYQDAFLAGFNSVFK